MATRIFKLNEISVQNMKIIEPRTFPVCYYNILFKINKIFLIMTIEMLSTTEFELKIIIIIITNQYYYIVPMNESNPMEIIQNLCNPH